LLGVTTVSIATPHGPLSLTDITLA